MAGSPAAIGTGSTLPAGTVLAGYNMQLAATGTGTARWTVAGGNLPPGLVLSTTGLISGTPTAEGTYVFTARVSYGSGESGCSASKQFSIAINPPEPSFAITAMQFPTLTACTLFSQRLAATGGTPPYRWELTKSQSLPAGITLNTDGLLSGSPTVSGSFPFGVQASDAAGATATRAFSLTVNAATVQITTASLPNGVVRSAYSQVLAATGIPSIAWRIAAGSLPQGLSLSGSGVLSGTPTQEGTFQITVEAGGGSDVCATQKSFTLKIGPASLTITTTSLLSGMVGVTYSQTLAVSGGTPPYTWSVTGSLPPGISLNSGTGVLSGTPTAAGIFNFTVQVRDATQNTTSKQLSIAVVAGLTISTAALPQGTVGVAYSQTLAAVGGSSPYNWSIAGSLPAGLTLNTSTGVIAGTPAAAGAFTFTVQVKDSAQRAASQPFTLTIARALSIVTATLEDGMVGAGYSATLEATGGTAPYTWSVVSGSLPSGLSLSATGIINGRPAAAGRYTFTLLAGDGISTATRVLSFTVAAPPSANFTGLSDTVNPAQQPGFGLTLASAPPMALTGRVTLTFAHNCANGADDEAIQFANGRRTVDFTVAANSTAVMFGSSQTTQLASTGTTAGAITLTVAMQARGEDVTPAPAPTRTVLINQTPPVLTSISASRTASGLEVRIVGYSTPRQVTQAVFRFTATGATLQTTEITIPLDAAFTKWYTDPSSPAYGSQFQYTQPFSVQGNSSQITSVTVTLSNSNGASQSSTANF